ncbi:pyruvate ferredoxin oxidoreductase [Sporanaerobium hydrogeniformans]|uniref:Pyruvate ferredoxin oxidoreductase n=1 Tax=Sporanaerobium hydrogeniformans TaxID=3072179 RepID=A0AC61D984_9FIRM|nr:indolepyruvate oxidoreductase subunit beta [Sporanaerobium hydrogeniformans]PHV69296.1 pyruvate ferredoxin oxidoreductase [Sporanaerobium hydrogeniformans]
MINCLITGVGGQGTVLASKLLAEAAMEEGYSVRTTETIGMAQRGGCVVSHVRMGETIYSPLIAKGQADMIISFEPSEAVRLLPYLKKEGVMVVNTAPIKPIIRPEDYNYETYITVLKEQVKHLKLVDGNSICKACDEPRVLNIALLGAAISTKVIPISKEKIETIMRRKFKDRVVEINLKALKLGIQEA